MENKNKKMEKDRNEEKHKKTGKDENRKIKTQENKKANMKTRKKKIIIGIALIIVVIAIIIGVVVYRINSETSTVSDDTAPDVIEKDTPVPDGNAIEEARANETYEEPETYETATEYTEDATESDITVESTEVDENTILITNGATVNLSNATIIRNAEDSEDEKGAKQFGIGAAVLAKNGTLNLSNSNISTNAKGATGLFAYTNGNIFVSDTVITTEGDNAGGLHTSTGGSISATNCTVTTNGENSAAIRSENDGGLMEIEGGTYTTNGKDSPVIYCIATVIARNATLTANNSEAVFIDGAHSITLENCVLSGNMTEIIGKHQFGDEALVYTIGIGQTSVKDETKKADFSMTGGTLTSNNGGLIYVTNSSAKITLENVEIQPSESNNFFLQCTGNNSDLEEAIWGTVGANGGSCDFDAINQYMEGNVIWDSISTIDFSMTDNSTLKGAIINDESALDGVEISETSVGYCDLTIDETTTWIVTGDSTLSSIENAGSIVDEDGKTVTIQNSNGKVFVQGDSSYTVTVDTYSK